MTTTYDDDAFSLVKHIKTLFGFLNNMCQICTQRLIPPRIMHLESFMSSKDNLFLFYSDNISDYFKLYCFSWMIKFFA